MNTTSTEVRKRRNRLVVVAGNKTREMLSLARMLRRFEYEVSTAATAAGPSSKSPQNVGPSLLPSWFFQA